MGLGVSGTPRRKPDRGGACCRTGGVAGSIPDAFCCGATVGEDKAQGRYPIAKVEGYSIFLTMFTSLEPCNNTELQTAVLNEMAQFFLEEKISHKPGLYAKSEESGQAQKKFERVAQRIKRERIKKSEQ